MTARKPVLLLDVMDTLVHDPFFDAIPAFFGLTLEALLAQKHPTAWIEFETGRKTQEEYYASMFRDQRRFDHAAFESAIKAAYRFLDGVQPLLVDLHGRGYEMHALSNNPVWYRWIEDKLQLSRYVTWSFVSCHTKLRKPDPAAYEHAARELARPPGECLFIDDRGANCHAAESVGMTALAFTGARALRLQLSSRGLL